MNPLTDDIQPFVDTEFHVSLGHTGRYFPTRKKRFITGVEGGWGEADAAGWIPPAGIAVVDLNSSLAKDNPLLVVQIAKRLIAVASTPTGGIHAYFTDSDEIGVGKKIVESNKDQNYVIAPGPEHRKLLGGLSPSIDIPEAVPVRDVAGKVPPVSMWALNVCSATLSKGAMRVAMCLAGGAAVSSNGTRTAGSCWWGVPKIVNQSGVVERDVKRSLAELKASGWITREPQPRRASKLTTLTIPNSQI